MEMLYTISHWKLFQESNQMKNKIEDVIVNGEPLDVFFCKNDKGMFVVAGKYRKTAPYRSCGHWHSGDSFYDIYFRKNFKTRDEGNAFYLQVKNTKRI